MKTFADTVWEDLVGINGQEAEIRRGEQLTTVKVVLRKNCVDLPKDTDVRIGDNVYCKLSDKKFTVIDTEKLIVEGNVAYIKAFFEIHGGEIFKMAKIKLHTPIFTNDSEATTEYEVNDIIHMKSVTGDNDGQGTKFYLKGVSEEQFCLESVNILKKLVEDNKIEEKPFSIVQSGSGNSMSVGSGNQAISGRGWAKSGWWLTLIGVLIGVISVVWMVIKN